MSEDELPFFSQPSVESDYEENNPEKENLRLKAQKWIIDNPTIANLFLEVARKLATRKEKFGIGYVTEIVRWEFSFKYNEKFKISNNYRAYIARWLINQDPSLEEFLSFKKTRY